MIDVLATTDRRGFGVRTALAIAGIPHATITPSGGGSGRALVLAGEEDRRSGGGFLAVGAPAARVRSHFGVAGGRSILGPLTLSLDQPVWPESVRALAARFGARALVLPRAPLFVPAGSPTGTVLATASDREGREHPAVIEHEGGVWALVDLGAALADLLDEGYLAAGPPPPTPAFMRPFLALYYRAPEILRRGVQRRAYARMAARLGPTSSTYPVDATGWLLVELLSHLVRRVAGILVRVAPWPAPYTAAAVLTHDVEPAAFAYGEGLDRLLGLVSRTGHPATLGLVAGQASRRLGGERVAALGPYEVLCHGLEHRGETLAGSPQAIEDGIIRARDLLARTIRRPVVGFRSPRLDRSLDLLGALDRSGMRWDSSWPDVDRENVARFGGGVRLNVPYRAPIGDGSRVRPSRCLELPVSAPDCVQPLFAGDDVATLRNAVRAKVDFIRATHGVYVGIVHGGVFGRRDAERRGEHLGFVADTLRQPDVWLTRPSHVADWWVAREALQVTVGAGSVEVANGGMRPVSGVRLLVATADGEVAHVLPALLPGGSARVAVGGDRAAAGATT